MKTRLPEIIGVPIFVFLVLLQVASAERVAVPVIRRVNATGPYGDIQSRLGNWSTYMAGEAYGTACHEGAHGLHSQIRNQRGGTGRVNAVYLGNGRAYVLPEPRGFRTSQAIGNLPRPFLATSHWEENPLYLLDELVAYFWSSTGTAYARDWSTFPGSYQFARQMLAINRNLVRLCRQTGYSHSDELEHVVNCVEAGLDQIRVTVGESHTYYPPGSTVKIQVITKPVRETTQGAMR
jgi:hypothetical protein